MSRSRSYRGRYLLVVEVAVLGWSSWWDYGGGAPKPELYGLWEITEFRMAGRSPRCSPTRIAGSGW
ncbi:hypothetical protein AB0H42_13275 [Nocardia sp. NPDC050799]|uniref:hypothetical protein n=1 Tax=Nocardia sp. NPDC050799 TaxID=3154842 RepID=UPI0033EDDD85